MSKILVLGAGHSSPYLVHHLLSHARALDATLTVADRDAGAAEARVAGHERGRAIGFDLGDAEACAREFAAADVVVHLLPPALQPKVARLCLAHGCHLVSASYRSRDVTELDAEARERGLTLLCELGLDPGIDLMSAQRLIEDLEARGGEVERFLSYGGGLPEPSFDGNPLRYCVTWNPRNVVMAGEHGAQYLYRGRIRLEPWHRVFEASWPVDVPGLGTFDAYSNRDSVAYRTVHGLEHVQTLVRGTLRYPGFCRAWQLVVRLGLPSERLRVPELAERTWSELVEMFLPDDGPGSGDGDLRTRVAAYLDVPADDERLDVLEWLGLFADEPVGGSGRHPTDALVALFQHKLPLPPGVRDLVVLHHELVAVYRDGGEARRERTLSTLAHYGDPQGRAGGFTAMAKGVGLPLALGTRLLLEGRLHHRGCLGPTDDEVYGPVLDALEAEGLRFVESVEPVAD